MRNNGKLPTKYMAQRSKYTAYHAALRSSAGNINMAPISSLQKCFFLKLTFPEKTLPRKEATSGEGRRNLSSTFRFCVPKMLKCMTLFTTRNYIPFSPFYFLDEKMAVQAKVPAS